MQKYSDVAISITVLGSVLAHAWMAPFKPDRLFNWGRSDVAIKKMWAGGWCKSDISILLNRISPRAMYCASMLSPRASLKDNGRCRFD